MKKQIIYVVVKASKIVKSNVVPVEAYQSESDAIIARDDWNRISKDSQYSINAIPMWN